MKETHSSAQCVKSITYKQQITHMDAKNPIPPAGPDSALQISQHNLHA